MQRYPIHGYGIPQLMNQIIPAVMKQQGIAQQREEQMRQEQKAAQEKQRQDKLAETQWKRGKQFDMAMKTGDFILKAKDLPYNVLKPAVDMFVKAGKTVGYDFDARALLDETQRATAVKTGIQNKLGELFEKAQSGDPRSVQEFMVANADYAKVNGGKLHEVFGPAMQELTKNAMSPSGGMTGDMGQLEQAKRMLQRQGGMGGGQPNINQPDPLNPNRLMASSTAGETANMGPMQLLQKLQEMKQTPKQLTPQQEAFQRLSPEEQRNVILEGTTKPGKIWVHNPKTGVQFQIKEFLPIPKGFEKGQRGYKPKEEGALKYDKNIHVAAQAVGIQPSKVIKGTLTQGEAQKLADKYKELFGADDILKALLKMTGGSPGGPINMSPQGPVKFDNKGNLIK